MRNNKSTYINRKIKRRFKIVSKKRFCIFIASIWLLICPVISLAMGYSENRNSENYIKVIKVYVEKGDTLWDIAKRTLPKRTDIRDYIEEIKIINQMETAQIREGEILKVPIYP